MQIRHLVLAASMAACTLAVNCTDGAVVFAVRGSDPNHTTLDTDPAYADIGAGLTATANAIIKEYGSGYISAVPYPANNQPGEYLQSVAIGINATQKAIKQYINKCANGTIFVLGFSQGAQVVGSVLGGTTDVVPLKNNARIKGVALFADPTFINQIRPLDSGNATSNTVNGSVSGGDSRYPYLNQHYRSRMRSYCQSGDQFCNSGFNVSAATAHAIHLAEPDTFQMNATKFLTSLK